MFLVFQCTSQLPSTFMCSILNEIGQGVMYELIFFLSTILNPDFFLFQSDASHHSILTFSVSTFTHTKQQLSHVTIAVQESDRRLPSVGIKSSRISLNLLLFSLPSTLRLTACSYSRPVSSQAACSMCEHSTLNRNVRGEM